jgi:dihydroorotate dehydrogenase (fumarate)
MSIDLSTSYGGIPLKNPIVVGACNIVTDLQNLMKLEEAGAAAIIFKSLFEEQIELESLQRDQLHEDFSNWDAEHSTLFPKIKHAGPAEHLKQLKQAKQSLSIPVIGSLNCINEDSWIDLALKMEDTGIDGLELNLYNHSSDFALRSDSIEDRQVKTLEHIRKRVRLPLFVKLSPFYTNALPVISKMDLVGVDGFVLFNRLFQPDIDIENEVHHYPYNFSSESDNRLALRFAGLLYKKISGSIICNTGIFSGRDVVKMLLAGADTVQVVSAIYKKGIHVITGMLEDVESWMQKKHYKSILDFQGKLSKEYLSDPFAYQRAQYIDILMKSEIFMQYHPKRGELENRLEDDI